MKKFLKHKLNGRSQRWLCEKIKMNEVEFSNSLGGIHRKFRTWEWDKIKEVLEITKEEEQLDVIQDYKFSSEPIVRKNQIV